MVTRKPTEQFAVGDHVLVDSGVYDAEGVITEIYGSGVLWRAMVRVPILGASGEELDSVEFSVPARSIRHPEVRH